MVIMDWLILTIRDIIKLVLTKKVSDPVLLKLLF